MACHILIPPNFPEISTCRLSHETVLIMIFALLSPRNSTSVEVDIDNRRELLLIVGPILIGALFNWFLLGALTMQVYVYYLCFPRDYWWTKFSAYGLYLLEIGQTVLATEIAWAEVCAGWGISSSLLHIGWGFSMNPLLSSLIACWVQIFFAWRVWALGRNAFWKSVVVVILVASFVQGCAGVILGVKLSFVGYLNGRAEVLAKDLYFLCLSASAFANFLITVSMLYFLISAGRQTVRSKETDRRITKLIRSTFETGALSAATALLDLIIYVRAGYAHISIVMVLSKLYSNALMVSLNSRTGVYERPTMSDSPEGGHMTSGCFNTAQFTSIGIPVTTGEFEWVNGRDGLGDESSQEYVKTGHVRASIALTNPGRG